jgi:hypothetical protein
MIKMILSNWKTPGQYALSQENVNAIHLPVNIQVTICSDGV